MSGAVLIILGSIAISLARTMVNHSLVLAAALIIAGASWASPSSAASAPDAWITTDAKVRLIANSDTPARDINVDTLAGVVTLFGTVPTEAARRAAELEVKKIDGVKSVENDLQVVANWRPPRSSNGTTG